MAFVGWILREIAIFAFRTYRIPKLDSSFGFGFETGRIAASIATGHGFSSPFQPQTGPTAWLAPLYPYLLAGVFKLFGVYTRSSAIVILSINSVSLLSPWLCSTTLREEPWDRAERSGLDGSHRSFPTLGIGR